ncbi:hypothetical protein MTO96_005697 [Rhipicephalus appendiculatus]
MSRVNLAYWSPLFSAGQFGGAALSPVPGGLCAAASSRRLGLALHGIVGAEFSTLSGTPQTNVRRQQEAAAGVAGRGSSHAGGNRGASACTLVSSTDSGRSAAHGCLSGGEKAAESVGLRGGASFLLYGSHSSREAFCSAAGFRKKKKHTRGKNYSAGSVVRRLAAQPT